MHADVVVHVEVEQRTALALGLVYDEVVERRRLRGAQRVEGGMSARSNVRKYSTASASEPTDLPTMAELPRMEAAEAEAGGLNPATPPVDDDSRRACGASGQTNETCRARQKRQMMTCQALE